MIFNLDSLHITRTYGGCYEGRPPVAAMIKIAKEYAVKYFGENRPTLVLDPKIELDPPSRSPALRFRPENLERLPQWRFIGWFHGPAKDKDMDGSHLVVIWWADKGPIGFELPPEVQNLDWNAHAEDYGI